MDYMLQLAVARTPSSAESMRLLKFLSDQRQVYQEDGKSAASLLTRPGMTLDAGASPAQAAELAAWTAVGRVLLNLDDFMTRN